MDVSVPDEWRTDLNLAPFVTRHLIRPIALLAVEFSLYALAVGGAVLLAPVWEKLACALRRRRSDCDDGDHRT